MKSIDTHKRTLIKTFSWRIIAFFITFLVVYVATRDFGLSASLGIVANLIKMGAYYIHERFWNSTNFGIQTTPNTGFTLWFTGLSGSGKSTLADTVAIELEKYGLPIEKLDGDVVRKTICRDLGFSAEDRQKNIERVTEVAKLLAKNRAAVLTSFISPYRHIRDTARKEIGEHFIEVFVKCPLDVCIQRDVKGLYKKALAGEIQNFTGISDPYEEPENPEIVIETDKETVGKSTRKIIHHLRKNGYIS